jgi:hypothetical protein
MLHTVDLEEVNVKVVLSGLPSVVVERRDVTPHAAIDLALRATERAVRRSVALAGA